MSCPHILLPIGLNGPGSWTRALPKALETCKTSSGQLHVITVVPDVNARAPWSRNDRSENAEASQEAQAIDFFESWHEHEFANYRESVP